MTNKRLFPMFMAATLTGCGAVAGTPPQQSASSSLSYLRPDAMQSPIKHIVVVIQENRSFDNIFAGFPGADTARSGYLHDGTKVALEKIEFVQHDMDHYFETGILDWNNGKMNQFDLNGTSGGQTIGPFAYSYLDRSAVAPYWSIAKKYVLADHMFPTMFGPSYSAHLTLIAGTADLNPSTSEADFPTADPWGCDAPAGTTTLTVNTQRVVSDNGPFPCYTQIRTLADTLDAAHVSWKYYSTPVVGGGGMWSAFDSIKNVRYGSDWKNNVVAPPQRFLRDAAAGRLASVSWIVPDFLWSDHPYAGTPYGPSWVSAIINAVGKSKEWNSTAIVVVWDDWGGFYDNVPPPQIDFRGLGIRVGCLIVSPYVHSHVSHDVYEFGSIIKFVEQTFDLPPLGARSAGYTDTRSTSIVTSFDFAMKPRSFTAIQAPYPASFFLGHAPSLTAPDDY